MKKRIVALLLAALFTFSNMDMSALATANEQETESELEEGADEDALEEATDEDCSDVDTEDAAEEEGVLTEDEIVVEAPQMDADLLAELQALDEQEDTEVVYFDNGEYIILHDLPEDPEVDSIHSYDESGMECVTAESIPAVYNPVDSANYLPTVRNQNPYGTCWAHSAIGVSEIYLTKTQGVSTNINLSESHLVYVTQQESQLDPLGLTVGDSVVSDTANDYSNSGINRDNAFEHGGNVYYAVQTLVGWQGYAKDEGKFSYGEYYGTGENKTATRISYLGTNGMTQAEAYADEYHLQNYRMISRTDEADVKKAVMENGAVSVSYWHDSNYINNDLYFYNYDKTSTNHAVTIVGWDDTISKEKFGNAENRPSRDGAWLIRNSWNYGSSKKYSTYCYFWISYDDASLSRTCYILMPEEASNYDNNYHYDRGLSSGSIGIRNGASMANIYTAKVGGNGEYIKAVGFETGQTNLNYTAKVYLNPDVDNPSSGELIATKSGATDYEGFYTVKLDSPVYLEAGSRFSVVIELSTQDNSTIRIPYEYSYKSTGWVDVEVTSHENESFYSCEGWGFWVDFYNYYSNSGNFRIHAYTSDADAPESETYRVSFDANGGTFEGDASREVTLGETYGALPIPVKEGYVFAGWYTAVDGGEKVSKDTIVTITSNHTLYAHWTPETYDICFDPAGGNYEGETNRTVTFGEVYGELPVPVKEGYTFTGWYIRSEDIFVNNTTKVFVSRNHTLVASYTPNNYTVSFNTMGGNDVSDKNITFAQNYGTLPTPVRLNAEFLGWYTQPEGGERVTASTQMLTAKDHTLYAHWNVTVKYQTLNPVLQTISGADTNLLTGTKVNILCETKGATIYYTLDGSTPDPSNVVTEGTAGTHIYEDAIVLTEDVTIKAVAVKDGYRDSDVVSQSFTILNPAEDWGDVTEADKLTMNFADATQIPSGLWTLPVEDATYTGKQITCNELRVFDGKKLLTLGTDYTLSYEKNVNVGIAKVIITGKGNYSGKQTVSFNITPLNLTDAELYATAADITRGYTGKVQKGTTAVTVVIDGKIVTLRNGTDYTLEYPETDVNGTVTGNDVLKVAGDYQITVQGKGNYEGSITFVETIFPRALRNLSGARYAGTLTKTYDYNDGTPIEPLVAVGSAEHTASVTYGTGSSMESLKGIEITAYETLKGTNPEEAKTYDYTYEYVGDTTKAGSIKIVFRGINGYTGTVNKTYKITGIAVSTLGVTYTNAFTYTGEEIKPGDLPDFSVYVKAKGTTPAKTLTMGVDYSVRYEKNVNNGTATMIITGMGIYTGELKKTFRINQYAVKSVSDPRITVADIPTQNYEKGGIKPTVIVKDGERTLVEGKDYTLSYTNTNKIHNGTGSGAPLVKITFRGAYKGTITKTFAIERKNLSEGSISITATDVTYQNKAGICRSTVKLVDGNGKTLLSGTDYNATLIYTYAQDAMVYQMVNGKRVDIIRSEGEAVNAKDIIPAGTEIKATVTGKGCYEGTKEVSFVFTEKSITGAKVTIAAQTYDGKAVELTKDDIKIVVNGVTLKKTDYEIVGYTNNEKTGTASVILKGKGAYGGTKVVTFTIRAKGM